MPDEGPALLVCNHVSYMDALILSARSRGRCASSCTTRSSDIPVLSWIFRTAQAIPIAGAQKIAALMQRAFDEVDAALAEGEIVGIFPEGRLTRTARSRRSTGRGEDPGSAGRCRWCRWRCAACGAACGAGATPRLGRMRLPRRFRARVELLVDAPIVPDQITAASLEARVRTLRGDLVVDWGLRSQRGSTSPDQPPITISATTLSQASTRAQQSAAQAPQLDPAIGLLLGITVAGFYVDEHIGLGGSAEKNRVRDCTSW